MLNEKDFESLKRLEEKLGEKLKELPLEKIMGSTNGYSYDEDGNMIGLNLWNSGTADISFLRDFPRLKHLHLGVNQITDLSPLRTLINLTELRLYGNKITDLSPLRTLIKLTQLDLSVNQITDLSPLRTLIKLTQLDLSNNQITDLSPLMTLINLTDLRLYSNKITDLSPLRTLIKLTQLRLGDNQITDLSPLQQLIHLAELLLYSNQITDLLPIHQLNNLTRLDLRGNQITDLSHLQTLTNLTELYLSENQITDLSPLHQLNNLTRLDLRANQITDLSPLQTLTNLTELYLDDNQITDLSPLRALTNLTILGLGSTKITDLSHLRTLTNLTELYLNGNQITDFSPLKHLAHLTELSLSNNQITDLTPLRHLTKLAILYLYKNQITDLSPLLPLKKLKRLDMRYNDIARLPEEWTGREMKIKWENDYGGGFFLEGNPLEEPPVEIVQRGDAAIRNYFKEIKERETVLLLHSKLLLVGSGAVGKTTLVKKLENRKFKVIQGKEPTTHGINIVPWELSCTFANRETHPVKIHSWDFGGQDILYTTHQFFLTKRSLYLFVWEARQEGQETASFEYWLNIIKLLSAGSPVIIVMNKADSRTLQIPEASFRDKFPNIRAFCQVSCLTGKGIAELTELIRAGLSEMTHLQDRLPKTWLQIRDDLKKQKKDYISLAEYLAICEKKNLNRERAEFVSDYLHDLGVILHFRGEPLLADTVILNPEWATSAVYKIMDTPAIIHNKGRFHYDDLKTYWDPRVFPTEKHPQLLRLMEKFELCFPVRDTKIHIVPELLPAGQPVLELEKYRGTASLRFEYNYEFMPRGILSRFITRLYYYIHLEHYWKTGVELTLDNTFALVQSDPLNRKLTVTVTGADKSELLAIARHHLEEIHRSLNMEKDEHYREMIPCNCDPCQTAAKPHLFRREVLKRFHDKGLKEAQCQESGEQVFIDRLLKGYALPQKTDLKELLAALIATATRLQGRAKAVKTDEDSRNTFIAEILSARGYTVKDQTRWGSSFSGKRPGELDIFIETPDGNAVSVIEAFNLTGFNRGVIADHFQKIFLYDAPGLGTNYIIVYAESADFGKLWCDYLSFLPQVEVKYKLQAVPVQGAPMEEKTPYADIKLARTVHSRHNRETAVYHLFINMQP